MRHRRSTRRRLAALGAGPGHLPGSALALPASTAVPPGPVALSSGGPGDLVRPVGAAVQRHPRLIALVVLSSVAVGAGLASGVMAALLAVVYTGLALRALRRANANRLAGTVRTAALDVIVGLAADLRAGVAPASALDTARCGLDAPDRAVRRARERLDAACEVSERLGAPLADLLDRVEADLRATERTRASVSAQTSGAKASALLLALLPVAGIGLGYALDADPMRILLHTPVGAICLAAAITLQCVGLGWTARLCSSTVERAA